MNLMEFLIKMENSLNCIEVKGEGNLDLLLGCLLYVKQMKQFLNSMIPPEKESEAEDGRQSDIGAVTSNDSNDK